MIRLFKTKTYFNPDPVLPPPPTPPPTFTQEQVNAMLAENKKALQKQNAELVTQLETLKTSKGLSEQEKADLQARIDQLSTEHMTEQQKLQAQVATLEKTGKAALESATGESKKWQGEYQKLLVTNGIAQGAVKHSAARASQLEAMLLPRAKVVEMLDEAGNPTGVYEARLPITVMDAKTKKPVLVELPIVEAIGKMREDPENANLFLTDGKPGLGGTNLGGGGGGKGGGFRSDMTPAEYRKFRKE